MPFLFSGLTIDSTAANLVPSNPGLGSLVNQKRKKRKLWTRGALDRELSRYDSQYERNQYLRRIIDRAKNPIAALPSTSDINSGMRSERRVCNIYDAWDTIVWGIFNTWVWSLIPDTKQSATADHC